MLHLLSHERSREGRDPKYFLTTDGFTPSNLCASGFYNSIITKGWDPVLKVQYYDVPGRPYSAILTGMYCPGGVCGDITETSQWVYWQYEIVDYNHNFPVTRLLWHLLYLRFS